MKELISQIEKEIKRDLLPKLKLFKNFKLIEICRKSDKLGYYKPNTCKKPLIKLNLLQIYNACKKYNVDLWAGIYSTILHELGHAIQDYRGVEFNEEEAEHFAYIYYYEREILKI